MDISTDDCGSWERSSLVPLRRANCEYYRMHRPYDRHFVYGKGTLQPTLWQDEEERVHMLLRSTSSRIFRSDSPDGGHTWCVAYDTGLPNNNSGIDLVRRDSGGFLLSGGDLRAERGDSRHLYLESGKYRVCQAGVGRLKRGGCGRYADMS